MGAIQPKKKNRIISKVRTKYWSKNLKYGVRKPKNVTEAMQIDQENGNTYWKDTIDKDVKKDKISYKSRKIAHQRKCKKVR